MRPNPKHPNDAPQIPLNETGDQRRARLAERELSGSSLYIPEHVSDALLGKTECHPHNLKPGDEFVAIFSIPNSTTRHLAIYCQGTVSSMADPKRGYVTYFTRNREPGFILFNSQKIIDKQLTYYRKGKAADR